MKNVQAVLFDLDGTLIDSVPPYFDLMADMLEAVGLPQAPRSLVANFLTDGLSALEQMIPADMAHRKDELIEQLLAVGRPLSNEMFLHRIQMIPGVEQLLPLLASRGISLGVVTSTDRRNIDKKLVTLERKGLRALLEVVIATEDAPRRKPAPDPLWEGARRLDVPAGGCVYVGDSHVDMRAGRAAGMTTVGVLTGVDDSDTLLREEPTLLLDSVADLCPLFS
ncbi:MAG TPA: HAD family phosphatase [Deferrisomatales bacterium]|nr:HAD family phosphatase [Deferrisomatales bacterium]